LSPRDGECIVEVKAAGINMSDVKAALGAMPYAVWPRTPGRDYAGIVVAGPSSLVGKESGAAAANSASRRTARWPAYLVVSASEISEKPRNISLDEAGAIGVPFVTPPSMDCAARVA